MKANPREVVEKLIALALHNPEPEEARSAAMKAVRLIEEHRLLRGPGVPPSIEPVGRARAARQAPVRDAYEDWLAREYQKWQQAANNTTSDWLYDIQLDLYINRKTGERMSGIAWHAQGRSRP